MANGLDKDLLKTLLFFVGVTKMTATTKNPEAQIELRFLRFGQPMELNLTLRQICDCLQNQQQGGDSPGGRPKELQRV